VDAGLDFDYDEPNSLPSRASHLTEPLFPTAPCNSFMRRNLLFISVVCLALTAPFSRAADDLEIRGLGEIQVFYNDAELNWLDGGFSTTRFDEGSFPVQLGKLGVNLDYHVTDVLWL
jgi:hypothetical protein